IRKEWESISVSETEQEEELGAERRNLGRLSKGRRTPEAVFYLPILKALVELGGRGKLSAVLDIVHKTMKPILKEVDYQPLASDPEKPRWRNTAQWARNSMRQEGLIKTASPYGIWEITDAGRERLEQGR
ncbi:MAG: winged helix-turn-helix domain-containing protein, partial [Saccharofermentanales bacterium]